MGAGASDHHHSSTESGVAAGSGREGWRRFPIIAFVFSGLALGLALSPRFEGISRSLWPPPASLERSALIRAVASARPIRARLTGEFAYGPTPVTRAANPRAHRLTPDVRIAVARIEKLLIERGDSVDNRAMLGVARLISGETDPAIALLESAASEQPTSRLLTDLSAGYLTRGRPDDLSAALDAAERAAQEDPRLREALFNRALAFEGLHLRSHALAAWREFLGQDNTSPWALEARSSIEDLQRTSLGSDFAACRHELTDTQTTLREERLHACVRAFPGEVRELIETDLLAEWGTAHEGSDARRAAALADRTEQIAVRLAAESGDQLPLAITRAAGSSKQWADVLARAHIQYRDARQAYDRQDFGPAGEEMRSATDQFSRAGSPAAYWGRFHLAVIAYQRGALVESGERLAGLRGEAQQRSFLNLLGRIEWIQGILDTSRGRFAEAVSAADRALALFSRTREGEAIASLHAVQADNLRRVGEAARSWQELLPAFAWLSDAKTSPRRVLINHVAALTSLQQGRLASAGHFFRAYLQAAQASGNVVAVTEARLHRARWAFTRGARADAERDLDAARAGLADSRNAALKETIDARIRLTEGEGLARIDPQSAITPLTKAIQHFEKVGRQLFLPRALLARGLAYRAQGDRSAAEADWRTGLEHFEAMRMQAGSEAQRISYFDDAWRLFDGLVDLSMQQGRQAVAFQYADRGRARSLIEASAGPAPMTTPEQLASRLPSRTALVSYSTLEDRLVVWVIRAGRVRCETVRVSRDQLQRLAAQWRRTFDTEFSHVRRTELARTLGRLLLAPVEPAADETLIFVLDGPLHGLPLAALMPPNGDRFLIEDHAIRVASRASDLLDDRAPDVGPRAAHIVAVGNPTVTSTRLSPLPMLPSAEREAREVASAFERSVVLTGAAATRDAFMNALPDADVVHFAGHAVPNGEYPDLSSMIFATSRSGQDEELRAADIAALRLSHLNLVVLSACDTAAGATRRGEGGLSLARPFLKAGARQVIATLWAIDDAAARSLFRRFYRELRANTPVAEALRRAQIEAMRTESPDAPTWASIVLYSR